LAKQRLAKQRGKKPPDERDWDHLHAHYLLQRDIFLTWDDGIICLSKELKDNFGINVSKPDEYLQTFTAAIRILSPLNTAPSGCLRRARTAGIAALLGFSEL
jgi:hypothetical protein